MTPECLADCLPVRIVGRYVLPAPFVVLEWFARCGPASTWTRFVWVGRN